MPWLVRAIAGHRLLPIIDGNSDREQSAALLVMEGRGRPMSVVPEPGALGQIRLFHDLTPAELARVHGLLHGTTFPAGTAIMSVDQPGEVAYIVRRGTLKIHVEQASGTNVILAILGPGEVVGELSLLDIPSRSATVVTMEESALLWMGRADFTACLRAVPGMAYNLATILARRLRLANEQIQALATLDVYGRVARQVLAFADAYGQPAGSGSVLIPLHLTQSDLADLVGASRVRVNQVLGAFRERRAISVDRDARIIIHQPAALAEYCQ